MERGAAHRRDHRRSAAGAAPARAPAGAPLPRRTALEAPLRRAADHPFRDLADGRRQHVAADVRRPLWPDQPDDRLGFGRARLDPVDDPGCLGLSRDHHLRRLGVDAIHVHHPARRLVERRSRAARCRRHRRREHLADVPLRQPAGDLAGDDDRSADPRARSDPTVRHRVAAHPGRAGQRDRDDLDLHVRARLSGIRDQLHGCDGRRPARCCSPSCSSRALRRMEIAR